MRFYYDGEIQVLNEDALQTKLMKAIHEYAFLTNRNSNQLVLGQLEFAEFAAWVQLRKLRATEMNTFQLEKRQPEFEGHVILRGGMKTGVIAAELETPK